MPLIRFRRRTQAITIILTIAVVAVVGLLLLLMSRLAKFETSTTAENELASLTKTEIPPNVPGPPDLDDAVATVNNQIITQHAWQQATRLDAVMSQLAAQPIPTAEERPNQRVILDLTTRVNNLASPPPQTIRNIAFLTFNEGDVPPVTVAVDVPLPPSPPDDDDDNNVPLPPTVTPALPPAIQPTPVLPVSYLPETGTKEAQAKDAAVGGVLLLSMVFALEVAMLFWRARFKRKNK